MLRADMVAAFLPPDERERLATLRSLEILDTPPEKDFDDIVGLACALAGAPMALVTLVDAERQWFKARVGVNVTETPRDVAFCAHTILQDELFVVDDALEDPRFATNPLVTSGPAIRFYAGAALRAHDGRRVGTICVLDSGPRVASAPMRDALLALRRHVETVLALRQRNIELSRSNAVLERLRTEKDLLIQLIAHDMKNALSLTSIGDRDEAAEIGVDMLDAARGLDRLVFDMLDVSRRERGADLRVSLRPVQLAQQLEHLIASAKRRAAVRRVSITTEWADAEVLADRNLIVRVIENLLDNALRYSPTGGTVTLRSERVGDAVRLVISDCGPGIPPGERERIFSLYEQSASSDPRSRGIGLAFCRMAVEAQDGTVTAETNDAGGTSFCVTLRGT
jgi:signal transduction histidine kinase